MPLLRYVIEGGDDLRPAAVPTDDATLTTHYNKIIITVITGPPFDGTRNCVKEVTVVKLVVAVGST